MPEMRKLEARCVVVGGGPAGMIAGYLLALRGVETIVLEKHGDFFRDFRGDTIHPSTMAVLERLGLLDELLEIPHSEVTLLEARVGDATFAVADLAHVPGPRKFIALMPQWDFLNFLSERAQKLPAFRLLMKTEATEPIVECGRVRGVRAYSNERPLEIRAELTLAADGRHSVLRDALEMWPIDLRAAIDVLWLRLSRKPDEGAQAFGNIAPGGLLVTIPREGYYQCGLVIRKNGFDGVRARGLDALREELGRLAPFLAGRTDELKDWDDIKTLTVTIDRLKRWYKPGILFIGDSAHAMSPVGGVGINLAVQDAVAAARMLGPKLASGRSLPVGALRAVQRRRYFAVRVVQAFQRAVQNAVLRKALNSTEHQAVPIPLRVLAAAPFLRFAAARFIGWGVRPEMP